MNILTRFYNKLLGKHIEAVVHNMQPIAHTIDDISTNVLKEPALLYVGGDTVGDIVVTHADGTKGTIKQYNWSQSFMVIKVWNTGTSVDVKDNIKLYR